MERDMVGVWKKNGGNELLINEYCNDMDEEENEEVFGNVLTESFVLPEALWWSPIFSLPDLLLDGSAPTIFFAAIDGTIALLKDQKIAYMVEGHKAFEGVSSSVIVQGVDLDAMLKMGNYKESMNSLPCGLRAAGQSIACKVWKDMKFEFAAETLFGLRVARLEYPMRNKAVTRSSGQPSPSARDWSLRSPKSSPLFAAP
ncbi:hypothetical protein Syun_025817 [Stephania yunnanensis]|uniref:Uncharacterized protein n=1 Tax=Stephania yunnanensis TaxID=152371 RepID=A0AAP0HV56_9MAGN